MVFIVKIPVRSKQQQEEHEQPQQEQQQQQQLAPTAPAGQTDDAADLLASLASMSLTSTHAAAAASTHQPTSSPPTIPASSSTLSSPPPLSPIDAAPPSITDAAVLLPAATLDVYLSPAVEQHRYVRSRDISLIVERPQRIRAVCLGVAAALARCEEMQTAPVDELSEAMQTQMHVADSGVTAAAATTTAPVAIRVLHSQATMPLLSAAPALLSIHGHAFQQAAPDDVKPGETYVAYLARRCASAPTEPPSPVTRRTHAAAAAASTSPMTPTRELDNRLDAHAASHVRVDSTGAAESSAESSSDSSASSTGHAGNAGGGDGASEVPAPWSQGDLYLCGAKGDEDGGSAAAIEASLGALCGAIDAMYQAPSSNAAQQTASARTILLPTSTQDHTTPAAAAAKRAFVLTRPPGHHCGPTDPSGFCWINSVAVGAAHAYAQHGIDRVIILDVDLHHGDGTQAIAWRINAETARSDLEREARLEALRQAHAKAHGARKTATGRRSAPSSTTTSTAEHASVSASAVPSFEQQVPPRGLKIFYGSCHDVESFPCEDGDPDLVRNASLCIEGAHGQWIWNVHLEESGTPESFERLYASKYALLLSKARAFALQTHADRARTLVLLSTGMDACIGELPGLQRHGKSLPVDFYHRFTLDACRLAADVSDGKLISVLEGGYSDRALTSASLAHVAALASPETISAATTTQTPSAWWNVDALTHLEKLAKRASAPAPSTPAALASAAARRRAEPSWLSATAAHFQKLEKACGREPPVRSKAAAASAPVSPAGAAATTPKGTRARTRAQLGASPEAGDTTV